MLSFGQLFGSNFWSSFKCQPSESIEKLLRKEDCKLEELLDDSDILQECKNSNKNLIKYLNRDKIKELIDFITVMPEKDEHKRGHKFPFIANEVFNCDIQEVIEKFFIPPCEDAPEEEEHDEDNQAEDEDSTKFESGFEKDMGDSGSDSEEDMINQDHDDDHHENEDDTKVEEYNDEEHADEKAEEQKPAEEATTGNQDATPVEFDVSDKTEEKKLDTPEETTEEAKDIKKDKESSSPSTEDKPKEETPEETQNQTPVPVTANTEAASPPTENLKSEEKEASEETKQSEETPEAEHKDTEEVKETTGEHPTADSTIDDGSTHASEATTKENKKQPLSDNKYDLLEYLCRFIDTDSELNDVLAGYFARLCNILLQKKSIEMAKFFYTNSHYLLRFAYHSYSKSLTDTVIKILDINTDKLGLEEDYIRDVRQKFIIRLIERLDDGASEVSYEYSLNIFQIFNELTFKKSFYTLLVDGEVVESLGKILKKGSPECSSNAAIRILNVLISNLRDHLNQTTQMGGNTNYNAPDDDVIIQDDEADKKEESKTLEDHVANHHLVKYFIEQIVDFLVQQLDVAPEKQTLDLQYGDGQRVLGKKRLSCINLIESLVELDDQSVREKILETNFYPRLFELFLEHPYNTFLHLHLDNIFHRILRDQNATSNYKINFLKKLGIFEKLPPFWSNNQNLKFPSQREFRHGYLAFTTRMSNTIRDIAKSNKDFMDLTQAESWKHFVENDVDVYNEKNSIVLANRGGNRKDSDEFEGLEDEDDQRFKDLEERDDLDDKDDDDDDDDDDYPSNRNSLRETLQAYDPGKARDEHENMFVEGNYDKDEEEDNLFSGLNAKHHDDDSDDDKPIGGDYDDSSDSDSENEREDVTEDSGYYNNSYWQISQYSIDDLLQS